MRVLYVDQTGQLGGAELSMLDLIPRLCFSSEVALFADGPFRMALENAGVRVNVLDYPKLTGVHREDKLALLIRAIPSAFNLRNRLAILSHAFDLVYANTQKAFTIAALANIAKPARLVWHLRDMLTASHFNPGLRRIVIYLANRYATAIIANSKATMTAFIEAGGRANLVSVVHNGISPEPFDVLDECCVHRERAALNPSGAFLVGGFGRLAHWKGQHVLLDALEQLPSDVHGVLVGEALFGEDHYAGALRARSQSGNLRGRVHLLGFRTDIPLLMKMMDVIVHTSVAPEPFGRVIVEGMLAKRPVIATAAGGALEIVEHRVSGLLIPPDNHASLAEAILELKQDAELRGRLSAGGEARARACFSIDASVEGVRRIMERAQSDNGQINT